MREIERTSRQISETASALDEMYHNVVAKVPTSNADQLKAGDARSAIFAPINWVGEAIPCVDIRIAGPDIRVCLDFTQDLKTSGLSYREFVEIEPYFGSDLMPAIQLESIALCESALSADSTPSLRTDGCRQPAVA